MLNFVHKLAPAPSTGLFSRVSPLNLPRKTFYFSWRTDFRFLFFKLKNQIKDTSIHGIENQYTHLSLNHNLTWICFNICTYADTKKQEQNNAEKQSIMISQNVRSRFIESNQFYHKLHIFIYWNPDNFITTVPQRLCCGAVFPILNNCSILVKSSSLAPKSW